MELSEDLRYLSIHGIHWNLLGYIWSGQQRSRNIHIHNRGDTGWLAKELQHKSGIDTLRLHLQHKKPRGLRRLPLR